MAEEPIDRKRATEVAPAKERVVRLRVLRQDARDKPDTRRVQELEVSAPERATVHDCLELLRQTWDATERPAGGPVAWEASCLEGACGGCAMLVDGRAQLACVTPVADVGKPGRAISLAPLTKFPVERDLIVDRSGMTASLTEVHAWVSLGPSGPSAGPVESVERQQTRLSLAACIQCGACLEACPEVHGGSSFIGAFAINRAHLYNLHGSGALEKRARVRALMGEGGVGDCGKAQVCVEVCPVAIPLTESIAHVSRDATRELLFGWLGKDSY